MVKLSVADGASTKLSDICEFIIDSEHKTAPTQDSGYPYIRTPNIGRGRIITENLRYVSQESYIQWTRRGVPKSGDLILAREAPVGNVAIVKGRMKPCLGQRTVLIRPNTKLVDPHFLTYFLLGDEVQSKFHAFSIGATVPHLNMSDIRGLKLPQLPSLHEQRIIGSILSACNDLIENNRRLIKLLEELVRTLYREWFVHFRFPGHEEVEMVDSELGEIPKGWEVKPLLEVSDFLTGYPFKSRRFSENDDGVPVVRIRDILNNKTKTYTTETADEKYIIEKSDILVGMDGIFHMCIWANDKAYLNQRVARFRPLNELPQYYLFLALEEPIRYFNATITGTTVAHLGKMHLETINLLVPDSKTVEIVDEIFSPMMYLGINLRCQIEALQEIRDILLPGLVSGNIDVSNLDIEISITNTHKTPKYKN